MYYYPCNDYGNYDDFEEYEKYERCMPMMNMPMANMPMANMPMANMPMMNMPTMVGDNEELKVMYPKIYFKMYPMVKEHCDMLEVKYGTMYCPSKEEMHHMCKKICEKCEEHHRDDEDVDFDPSEDEDATRRRRYGRRRGFMDLARVLIIGSLIGRRRNRRRGYWR